MKTKDGVEYEDLGPTRYHGHRYKVTHIPDGMTRQIAAESIDGIAGMFGCKWDGDVLTIYTD